MGLEPPATVVSLRANAGQTEIARYTVPERVMSYDPAQELVGSAL